MAIVDGQSVWTEESFGAEIAEVTIGALLDAQTERHAGREALVFRDTAFGIDLRWSYAELHDRVAELARGLIAIGVARGDRVAVLAPNLPEWILLEYALATVGAVLVTVNVGYREQELDYLLRQGRINVLFAVAAYRGNDYLASVSALEAKAPLPDLRHRVLIGAGVAAGWMPWEDLLRRGETVPIAELGRRKGAVRPDDPVQIQYTSGTTGLPKGVMLSHRGVLNNARFMSLRAGWSDTERLLAVMPFFHAAGCVCNVLGMLVCSGTLLALVAFDGAQALAMIERERATIMNGVPTMYLRLLAEPGVREGKFADSSLHTAFMGGTSIPPVVLADMKACFGADPMVIMGMTECSPLITQTRHQDGFELASSTAGIPLPFTEIKVVDPLTGAPVPIGQQGELCIRGYGVTPGYFEMPDRTAEAIDRDGWLHSGDLATLGPGGHLRIVGRLKDMIIRGGENVYPAEIEALLMRHPAVEQVQVVGVPDPEFGEEAFAFVILHEGASLTQAALRDFARGQFSRHKVPRYMEFVATFPQTANGKVQKFELRELARDRVACA